MPEIMVEAQLLAYLVVGLIVYIDQRRGRAKEILLEAERSRAEAERSRANHFIAAISHDLRQPLTTLALKLKSLKAKTASPEADRDIQQLLRQQTIAMQTMVDGTLDLSRLKLGAWKVDVREVSLPHLIERVASDLQVEASEKNINIKTASVPYVVRTDPLALERIIRNLLGNAIRYTPENSIAGGGQILLECQLRGDFVRISVVDNGIGIPEDRLDDIFKEYVQLANPERDRTKGLGLGLSIVKGLAKLLNHGLEVESTAGEGARFSVLVPVIGKIPPELLPQGEDAGSTSDLSGMVVVFVEDEEGPRDALRERLIEWGCDVIDGESAEDVIAELRNEDTPGKPDFILSDYRLREKLTGIDAVAAIRKETSLTIPAAIWTAETSPSVLRQIAEEGLQILSKPPDEFALLSMLKKHHPTQRRQLKETSL